MTLHFTLILQVNTHCIAKYIDCKISFNLRAPIFQWGQLIVLQTYNHSCTIKLHKDDVAWPQAPSYAPVNINIDISGYRPWPPILQTFLLHCFNFLTVSHLKSVIYMWPSEQKPVMFAYKLKFILRIAPTYS